MGTSVFASDLTVNCSNEQLISAAQAQCGKSFKYVPGSNSYSQFEGQCTPDQSTEKLPYADYTCDQHYMLTLKTFWGSPTDVHFYTDGNCANIVVDKDSCNNN
jgi:hypothetical protein